MLENMQNSFAQVLDDDFHQLFELRIVKIPNKTNNNGLLKHLKIDGNTF